MDRSWVTHLASLGWSMAQESHSSLSSLSPTYSLPITSTVFSVTPFSNRTHPLVTALAANRPASQGHHLRRAGRRYCAEGRGRAAAPFPELPLSVKPLSAPCRTRAQLQLAAAQQGRGRGSAPCLPADAVCGAALCRCPRVSRSASGQCQPSDARPAGTVGGQAYLRRLAHC